jgi:hypothetical protein
MDVVLFILATAAIAAFLHTRIKSFIGASLLAATLAALGLQLIAFIQLGYLQALALIGFLTSWSLGIVIALLIGWWARKIDKKSGLAQSGKPPGSAGVAVEV